MSPSKVNLANLIKPFKPLDWQKRVWRDKSLIMLLTGSAGGGKSKVAAEKIHALNLKYPGTTSLCVRKTRESMTNSTVLFLANSVIGRDKSIYHNQSKHRFEYLNGSMLIYGGMKDDEQREQIRSIGLEGGVDFIWVEEANRLTESDFNELLARLRGRAAGWNQIMLTTNPDAPTHWIYRRLIVKGEASVHYSHAKDNPHNPERYQEVLNNLTGVLAQRLAKGLWMRAEGAVYEGWDESIHLIESFPIPSEWLRIMVVDFGYTHPFCAQWWAFDNDMRMFRYRELYGTKRMVTEWAVEIKRLSEGENIAHVFCDHDAEDRATLDAAGVITEGASKSVLPGIQAVQARLKVSADGKARIFLLQNALVYPDPFLLEHNLPTCTEEEIPAYVWASSAVLSSAKDTPIKINDHGVDCMRYAVAAADLPLINAKQTGVLLWDDLVSISPY